MPITVRWLTDDQTILLETFEGDWTISEHFQLVNEAARLLNTVSHPVHILVDGTHSGKLPAGLMNVYRYASRKVPRNQGMTIFVGVPYLTKSIVAMGQRLFPAIKDISFVNTIEESHQYFNQVILASQGQSTNF